MNVTDDRQTDGRATACSEHEREFTFAKTCTIVPRQLCLDVQKVQYKLHTASPLQQKSISPHYAVTDWTI